MSPRRVVRWLGARIVRPVDLADVLKWAAAVVLGLSVLAAVFLALFDRHDARSEARDLRQQLQAVAEVTDCRSRLSTDVQDKQTDYLIDIGDLVVALAHNEETDPFVEDLDQSRDALDTARDVRVAFEEDPSSECSVAP